jgi:hypothetical protein
MSRKKAPRVHDGHLEDRADAGDPGALEGEGTLRNPVDNSAAGSIIEAVDSSRKQEDG